MSNDNQPCSPEGRPQKPMFDQESGGQRKPPSSGVPVIDDAPAPREGTPSHTAANSGKKNENVHSSPATARKKAKKKLRNRIIAITAVSLVAVLVLGVFALWQWVKSSLRGEDTHDGSLPDEVTTDQLPEYTGKNIITGLICGIDYDDVDSYSSEDKVGHTDMIMYMMYNTDTGVVNILQIPRDMFVGEDLETGGTGKINALYYASPDGDNRMAALAKAVKDQLGLPTDFYVTLDMDALKALIDHIGSIAVYVPRDVKDPTPGSDAVMKEGWRYFTGEEAEYFLRNRNYADADITRLQMQQSFYSALFREFKQLSAWDLVMWMRILLYYVNVGGLSAENTVGLALEALNVEGSNVTFIRPPCTAAYYGSEFVLCLEPEETAALLNQYFRPDGHTVEAGDLDIHVLPMLDYVGKVETQIITMSDIQSAEPVLPD